MFTCEFLLLKLNLVNCMSSRQELGYDLSDKVSNIQAQINTNDQQIKNDLVTKITELDAKLVAEIDSDVATAVAGLKGDAAADFDTLGKLEDKIQTEASERSAADNVLDARIVTEASDRAAGDAADAAVCRRSP